MTVRRGYAEADMLQFETTLGRCGLRWGPNGITAVLMPGTNALKRAAPAATDDAPPPVREAASAITALLEGEPDDLRWVALDTGELDPFRRGVYDAARAIAPGETGTYGEIARALGSPLAARGVGAALAGNPYPIVVPCHRVLAADGTLHGFSAPGGIATKRRMLEIERAPGFTQQALFA
jgi:methylated-DNA-[protein]-cysteine S-methyltransferase